MPIADTPAPPATATASPRGGLPPKLIHIALLLLATLVAGWPISSLIEERESRQAGLLAEFRRNWGPEQVVHAPLLVVPLEMGDNRPRQYLKIAPATLNSDVQLKPERRQRGLFSATVFAAEVNMAGTFELPAPGSVAIEGGGKPRWQEAFVVLESAGLEGMRAEDSFQWDGQPLRWRICRDVIRRDEDCQGARVIAQPQFRNWPDAGAAIGFKASLSLRGTSAFRQVLEGRRVVAGMAAPWPTPSFSGTMLPSATTVEKDGFRAQWQSIESPQPQMWVSLKLPEGASVARGPEVGVELLEATPTYRMVHRVSKYNILFVTLAFTTYFLFELLSRVRIHSVQYALLGVSLTLFALLLVSFAEPLGYATGYAVSAGLVLAQASLYTGAVTRRVGPSLVFATMLASLFGFLYVLLSLETYALLLGSVALFLVLSLVMALTQRVDWWGGRA
jgi:inner membrane protein